MVLSTRGFLKSAAGHRRTLTSGRSDPRSAGWSASQDDRPDGRRGSGRAGGTHSTRDRHRRYRGRLQGLREVQGVEQGLPGGGARPPERI